MVDTIVRKGPRKVHDRAIRIADRRDRTRPGKVPVEYLSRAQGVALLDRQAKKYLGMSGPEFVEKYRAGQIEDPSSTNVLRVAILIPFAER